MASTPSLASAPVILAARARVAATVTASEPDAVSATSTWLSRSGRITTRALRPRGPGGIRGRAGQDLPLHSIFYRAHHRVVVPEVLVLARHQLVLAHQLLHPLGEGAVTGAQLLEAPRPRLGAEVVNATRQRHGSAIAPDLHQRGARLGGGGLVDVLGELEQRRHRRPIRRPSQHPGGAGARVPQPLLDQRD